MAICPCCKEASSHDSVLLATDSSLEYQHPLIWAFVAGETALQVPVRLPSMKKGPHARSDSDMRRRAGLHRCPLEVAQLREPVAGAVPVQHAAHAAAAVPASLLSAFAALRRVPKEERAVRGLSGPLPRSTGGDMTVTTPHAIIERSLLVCSR